MKFYFDNEFIAYSAEEALDYLTSEGYTLEEVFQLCLDNRIMEVL